MRDIKFRAWDKKYNEMIPDLIYFYKDGEISHNNHFNSDISPFRGYMWDSRNLKIMQYTGLKDKNGVEIYEGDIVKEDELGIGFIKYIESYFSIFRPYVFSVNLCNHTSPTINLNPKNKVEVIGNIYENPELLKSNK